LGFVPAFAFQRSPLIPRKTSRTPPKHPKKEL
jgi:hypothetical protein